MSGDGGGGGPSRCPSLSPGNRSPPPFIVLTHSVTHSPISQSLSLFLSLSLTCFSVTHSATTHFRFTGRKKRRKLGTGVSQSKLLILQKKRGDMPLRHAKVCNSSSFFSSFASPQSTPPSPSLLPLFVMSSVFSHYLLYPPPLPPRHSCESLPVLFPQ